MFLAEQNQLSEREVRKHIAWLRSEIDRCMMYDISLDDLEKELTVFNALLETGLCKRNDNIFGRLSPVQ